MKRQELHVRFVNQRAGDVAEQFGPKRGLPQPRTWPTAKQPNNKDSSPHVILQHIVRSSNPMRTQSTTAFQREPPPNDRGQARRGSGLQGLGQPVNQHISLYLYILERARFILLTISTPHMSVHPLPASNAVLLVSAMTRSGVKDASTTIPEMRLLLQG